MDYEKRYKEALERARQIKNGEDGWGYCDLIEITPALEEVFPELAESEDERIRKELIGMINELTNWAHKKEYVKYLEKQKESLHIPESCKENANSFTNEDERVRKEMVSMIKECTNWAHKKEYIAYLEKQAENPKSADSIPSDCVSVAKCEDRRQKHSISVDELAQDYVDGVKEYNSEPTWDLIQTAVCYGYHYREQKEQKPAEWSEEDEAMRNNIIRVLSAFVGTVECESNPSLSSSYPTYLREIDWLKSLRPQYHGDVTMTEAYKMGKEAGEASQWKPSEEQMKALEKAIIRVHSDDEIPILTELRQQLKKL